MPDIGTCVMICCPSSEFHGALGKIIAQGSTKTNKMVETINEDLLAYNGLNRGIFKVTELKRFFQPGAIVTVHNKDSRLDGEQGQVERYDRENDLFWVRFDEKMIGRRLEDWDKLVGFSSVDLSQDEEWRPEYQARILYPRGFWGLHILKTPFSTDGICMHGDCQKKVVKRCLINASGTVYQVDLCEEHVRLHGWCMDSFPFKK